jgi:hypothetical protein
MSRNRMKNSQSLQFMGVVKWILVAGLLAGLGLCYMICKNQNLHLAVESHRVQKQLDEITERNKGLALDLESMKGITVLKRRLAQMHSTLVPWGDTSAYWVRLDQNTRARLAHVGTMPQSTIGIDSVGVAASSTPPQTEH